jgi:hypothetical protein
MILLLYNFFTITIRGKAKGREIKIDKEREGGERDIERRRDKVNT